MKGFALTLTLMLFGGPAAAQGFTDCTKVEQRSFAEAVRTAKALTLRAAAAVGDTPEYQRWFGKYTPRNADLVRARLKSIHAAIRSGRIEGVCINTGREACERGTFAFVYSDEPFRIYVCSEFFSMPTMALLRPGAAESDTGSRAGTIIHEVSHYTIVAGTEDHCYTRVECTLMARQDAPAAIENADSYQYFTEDVTYFRADPIANKPRADPN